MKSSLDKYAIAAALQEIGTLLELKGGEYFKARVARRAWIRRREVLNTLGVKAFQKAVKPA